MLKRALPFLVGSMLILGIYLSGNSNSGAEGSLDREFTLKAGEQIELKPDGATVKFVGVPNDNRCKAICDWEGYAEVDVEVIAQTGEIYSITVNTTNQRGYSTTKIAGPYKVRLVGLKSSGAALPDYSVTLFVTKDMN